jgi:putative transposase
MPRTRKPKPTDIPEEILDHFAGPARPMSQAEVDAITKRFKKTLVERMLGGELTHHLGYPPAETSRRTPPITVTAPAPRRSSPTTVR